MPSDNRHHALRHRGYFAIPAPHLAEITALVEAKRTAVDAFQDDFQVLGNQLYDRAGAVASRSRSLRGAPHLSSFIELSGLLHARIRRHWTRDVLDPDACAAFHAEYVAYKRRAGGGDGLVRRVVKRDKEVITPESAARVIEAFEDVLGHAAATGCGFVTATRDDQAEARLAEKQRQWAESKARHDAMADDPPEVRAAQMAAIGAELDRLVEDGLADAMRAEQLAETRDRRSSVAFHAVADDDVAEIMDLMWELARYGEGDGSAHDHRYETPAATYDERRTRNRACFREACAMCVARARETIEPPMRSDFFATLDLDRLFVAAAFAAFGQDNDHESINSSDPIAAHRAAFAARPDVVLPPRQGNLVALPAASTARLADAIGRVADAWGADGAIAAALDRRLWTVDLTRAPPPVDDEQRFLLPSMRRVYEAYTRIALDAARDGLGMAWHLVVRDGR
jgi:hypothetical protein